FSRDWSSDVCSSDLTLPEPKAANDAGKDKAEAEAEEEKKEEAGKGRTPIRIDLEGLGDRVARVPVEADNYGALAVNEGHLFFMQIGRASCRESAQET